jgi:hypothetical protein
VRTLADLAELGLAATDVVLVEGYGCPILAGYAERLLPAPAPAALAVPPRATSR